MTMDFSKIEVYNEDIMTGLKQCLKAKFLILFSFLICFMVLTPSDEAFAVKTELLGQFKQWSAYVHINSKKKICYIVSKPTKQTGKYKSRGDTWLFVNLKPGQKTPGEISFKAGYRYKPKCDRSSDAKCQVNAKLGKKNFQMYSDKDISWVYADDQKNFISEMKKRGKLIIEGSSQRGTKTTDTISLMGFTKAYNTIRKACKS